MTEKKKEFDNVLPHLVGKSQTYQAHFSIIVSFFCLVFIFLHLLFFLKPFYLICCSDCYQHTMTLISFGTTVSQLNPLLYSLISPFNFRKTITKSHRTAHFQVIICLSVSAFKLG